MDRLETAARALLAHWDTPAWKYEKPTADLMADLREAIQQRDEIRQRFAAALPDFRGPYRMGTDPNGTVDLAEIEGNSTNG